MKQQDWRRAYEPLPAALPHQVAHTLSRLEGEGPARKGSFRTAAVVLAVLLTLGSAAYGLLESKTADIFGWFYGEEKKRELLAGDIAPSGQSYQLGYVVYTLEEAIYKDGVVYGTGTIKPAEGAKLVLIAEDYGVNEPAGYLLHYGQEEIPDDAPSYAELAAQKDAKILLAKCVANGVLNQDGTLNASEIGYTQLPQPDGTIRFTFEFQGGGAEDGKWIADTIERAESYDVSLHLANWEVTPEGDWLREDPENTYLTYEWTVTVTPVTKGE